MIKILFVTDIHGSDLVFRKFLNALSIYKANIGILMGDLCGKMLHPIVKQVDGSYRCTVMGSQRTASSEEQLKEIEKDIASMGNYCFYTDPEEMNRLRIEGKTIEGRIDERAAGVTLGAGKIDDLFRKAVVERLNGWMKLAEERLEGKDIEVFMAPGNDDLMEVNAVIDSSSRIKSADNQRNIIGEHEMITLSWSNPTPWNTERECSEEELENKIDQMVAQIENMETAIFNLHVPPYDTLLDKAPKLSEKLVPSTEETVSAGSQAVRRAIEKYQPMMALHGHIHESPGVIKIDRTVCMNPGSEYSEGILKGLLITLKDGKIKNQIFVSG